MYNVYIVDSADVRHGLDADLEREVLGGCARVELLFLNHESQFEPYLGQADAIKAATEELTQLFYKMSEKLYQQQAPQGEQAGPDAGAAGQGAQGGEYYDADYKVVDDDENKNK